MLKQKIKIKHLSAEKSFLRCRFFLFLRSVWMGRKFLISFFTLLSDEIFLHLKFCFQQKSANTCINHKWKCRKFSAFFFIQVEAVTERNWGNEWFESRIWSFQTARKSMLPVYSSLFKSNFRNKQKVLIWFHEKCF